MGCIKMKNTFGMFKEDLQGYNFQKLNEKLREINKEITHLRFKVHGKGMVETSSRNEESLLKNLKKMKAIVMTRMNEVKQENS